MISIQKPIRSLTDLSAEARLIFNWIPGSQAWFDFATKEDAPLYQFESEAVFLKSTASGLHNSDLIYLKNCQFFIAPERLLTFSLQQLRNIDSIIQQKYDQGEYHGLSKLTTGEKIFSTPQLTEITSLLKRLNLIDNPLFSNMTLDQWPSLLAVAEKVNTHKDKTAHIAQASIFSIERSANSESFCALFEFSLFVLPVFEKASTKKLKSDTRKVYKRLIKLYEYLVKNAFSFLSCPLLDGSVDEKNVTGLVNYYGENNQVIGFNCLSNAISQIAQNISIDALLSPNLMTAEIYRLGEVMCQFCKTCQVSEPRLSQNAKYWHYQASSKNYDADFSLSEDGCLYMNRFYKHTL